MVFGSQRHVPHFIKGEIGKKGVGPHRGSKKMPRGDSTNSKKRFNKVGLFISLGAKRNHLNPEGNYLTEGRAGEEKDVKKRPSDLDVGS